MMNKNAKTKTDRKNSRKISKMAQVVSRQAGVTISEEASKWLVVWGMGVASGVGKDEVLMYFQDSQANSTVTVKIEEVRLFIDQTYVFLRCSSEQEATELRDRYNGASFDEKQTLYVGFIDDKVGAIPEEDSKLLEPFNQPLPEGLLLIPEFISCDKEAELIENLVVDGSQSQLKKRAVKHFGYEFRYGSNDVDPMTPLPPEQRIPDYVKPIMEKMISTECVHAEPEQITVNQYSPGHGIPPHCDTHSCFEGNIISLSLGSSTVMDFRQPQADKICSVILPPRSLLVMSGESRYGWTHGITPRKFDIVPDKKNGGITVLPRKLRISLTFRKLPSKNSEEAVCRCQFPNLCDSQKGKISEENASNLENDLVHKVYEEIASHFTETRHKPWPNVKKFVEQLQPGSCLLDVGCANGKYFGINPDILEVGLDMSIGLLTKCFEKGHEVIRANALSLPFQENYFDGVISIAVLHHIATKERRLQFIQEILRVLKPSGQALIYVWSKEQNLDSGKKSTWSERQSERNLYNPPEACAREVSNYTFLPVHDREQEFSENDMLVPWVNTQEKKQNEKCAVHHRYYHVFTENELENLIKEMTPPTRPRIIDSYYEQGNWVALLEKV